MCAGGLGSILRADNLDSGFQPVGVGKMSSSQYVDGRPKTVNVYRAAVNGHVWFMLPAAHTTTRGSHTVRLVGSGHLER
jgi:hypothetical protein